MKSILTNGIGASMMAIAVFTCTAAPVHAAVQCRAELDRPVLPAGTTERAVIKIALDAPQPERSQDRPPVNLTIVLDRSGSMGGDKIERAKEAAIEALRRLSAHDLFAFVIYDDVVETLVPSQFARNTESIEARIRSIQPRGNTALFGGVSQGAAEARKHVDQHYVHRMILLSDGLANVGPSSPDELGQLGTALRKEGISVTTIGMGTDYSEDLMTRLAERSDGNTYFVESTKDLARIFNAELGDLLSVVARNVSVELECPPGVKPLRIIGRDGRVSGQKVELTMNQLYGGQQKYALVEVEVLPGKAEESRDMGLARCSYQDASTKQQVSASSTAKARFSENRVDVVKSANQQVQSDVAVNEAAAAKDVAIGLNDTGNKPAAVQQLRKKSAEFRSTAQSYDNADVAREADRLDKQAEELEAKGMSKSFRKALRAESWQERNMQKSK